MSASDVRRALARFGVDGHFGERDYEALRRLLSAVLRRHGADDLLDGLLGLFFERHVMNAKRREELLALPDQVFEKAIRARFRQVVDDDAPHAAVRHALRVHVRNALQRLGGAGGDTRPTAMGWPLQILQGDRFSSAAVEAALHALWTETGHKPTGSEALGELFRRYLNPNAADADLPLELPEVIGRQLDAQRLAAGILGLLSREEKDLLRHVLDGGAVEVWGDQSGVSRATAYRLLARLKSLCRLEFTARSDRTQLEALRALRGNLSPADPE